jgi:hypothetical protein
MRDRTIKPQQTTKYATTQDELDAIREDGENAQILLDNPYLKTYCNNKKHSILELHAKQAIYDRTESKVTNGITDTVIVPSEKEYTLLAGEYRFIDGLLSDLKQTVLIMQETNEKVKSEEIEVNE